MSFLSLFSIETNAPIQGLPKLFSIEEYSLKKLLFSVLFVLFNTLLLSKKVVFFELKFVVMLCLFPLKESEKFK